MEVEVEMAVGLTVVVRVVLGGSSSAGEESSSGGGIAWRGNSRWVMLEVDWRIGSII